MTTIFFSLLGKQSRVLAISSNKSSQKKTFEYWSLFHANITWGKSYYLQIAFKALMTSELKVFESY